MNIREQIDWMRNESFANPTVVSDIADTMEAMYEALHRVSAMEIPKDNPRVGALKMRGAAREALAKLDGSEE